MIFGVTVISQQLLKDWKRKQGKEKERKKWKRLLRWVTKWPTIHGVINVRGVFLWQIISKVHFRPNVTLTAKQRQLAVTHIASQQLLTSTTLMFTLGFCILRAGELEGVLCREWCTVGERRAKNSLVSSSCHCKRFSVTKHSFSASCVQNLVCNLYSKCKQNFKNRNFHPFGDEKTFSVSVKERYNF